MLWLALKAANTDGGGGDPGGEVPDTVDWSYPDGECETAVPPGVLAMLARGS